MTDTLSFLNWLHAKGGQATLGEILSTKFAAEYRKHISLLRTRMGYGIKVKLNRKVPSENLYRIMVEPVQFEGDQAVMFKEAV